MISFSKFIKRICFIGSHDCNHGGFNPPDETITGAVVHNNIIVTHNGVTVVHNGS